LPSNEHLLWLSYSGFQASCHSILGAADRHIETHVEQASWLRFSVLIINPIVKNAEETESSFVQCSPPSKQWKSLKCSPVEGLESASSTSAVANLIHLEGQI
jgi:hypothetical protein